MNSASANPPRFAAALSKLPETAEAAREVCRAIRDRLEGPLDLAMVFASIHHQPQFAELATTLQAELGAHCLLGCTGESIVCGDQEIEEAPALAVWVAQLPEARLTSMHLEYARTPEGGAIVGWPDALEGAWPAGATLLLLAEPYTFPADLLLENVNGTQPGATVIGGMASGGRGPNQNRLLFGGREVESGAVAVLIDGGLRIETVVSQGCRPIGRPFVVTKADRNVILQLGGLPALVQLQQMFQELTPEEQALARQGLHVGQVINEYQEQFGRGDFLVRNVQGVDPQVGAIAIGDDVRVGQTVQFHVRDAETADEDLHTLLAQSQKSAGSCLGALVFTCNGRGTRLFGEPHHDARAVAACGTQLPVAGFFAQGEIGPVGGKNFLHGFTASIALFRASQ